MLFSWKPEAEITVEEISKVHTGVIAFILNDSI